MNILKQMPDNVSGVTNLNNQSDTPVEAQENTQTLRFIGRWAELFRDFV